MQLLIRKMSLIRAVLSQKACRYDRVTSVQDKSRYKARYPLVQKHWIGGLCCSSSTLPYMPVMVVEGPCMAKVYITCNDFFLWNPFSAFYHILNPFLCLIWMFTSTSFFLHKCGSCNMSSLHWSIKLFTQSIQSEQGEKMSQGSARW